MTNLNGLIEDTKNVALCYIRQSQTRDENDMSSPERQRANIQRILDTHNWKAEWYEDAEGHKSGRDVKNRPGWLALAERLEDDDIAVLIANDLSRLHRKGWRVGDLVEQLERYNIDLIIAEPGREVDTSTPMGKMFIYFTAMFDEYYANDISYRIKSSVRHRRQEGKIVGPTPFGTVRDNNGYLMPINEGVWLLKDGKWQSGTQDQPPASTAVWRGYFEAAHEILKIYAQGDKGTDTIARQMNESGWAFRRRNGKPRSFHKEDIRRVCANWLQYGGLPDSKRSKERPGYKEVDADSVDLNSDRAVFDLELLYRVGKVRQERGQPRVAHGKNRQSHFYPLSNIMYCAHCEQLAHESGDLSLRTSFNGMISHGILRYRHKSPKQCDCNASTVRVEVVENAFQNLLHALYVPPETYQAMLAYAQELDAKQEKLQSSQLKQRQAHINACQRKLNAANHLYLDGIISRDEYNRRRESAEQDLHYWENLDVSIETVEVHLKTCVDAIQSLSTMWGHATREEKQRMVRHLFSYIVYNVNQQCIVDFRLKPWANHFLVLRAALHDATVDSASLLGLQTQNATSQKEKLRAVSLLRHKMNQIPQTQSIFLNRSSTLSGHRSRVI